MTEIQEPEQDFHTLTVHMADTYPDMDIGAEEIRDWHVNENGWSDIGYHLVIRRNGQWEWGRPLERQGAHVLGHNAGNIGICLVGGKSADDKPFFNFTHDQMVSLWAAIHYFRGFYGDLKLRGHRDLDPSRKCPGFDVRMLFEKAGRP